MKPCKQLGQHFLCDQLIIRNIIQALAVEPSDHLVEIGPGQGALTFPILKMHPQLDVIEIDTQLVNYLKNKTIHHQQLSIYEHDVLSFDFNRIIENVSQKIRVIGNLPYNISTPLIFHLLNYTNHIHNMVFMVQKEVALRLCANPGTKIYGRLSVMVQYFCELKYLFDIPPNAFYPPPKVDSSMIRLTPYQRLPAKALDFSLFTTIVREAFNHRRKTLRNSLKTIIPDEKWPHISINPKARAEELTVLDYVNLANNLLEKQ